MAANYILLETITVGEAGASSISFQNIPQSGYTDVKVVYSVRTTGGSGQWMNLSLSFNGLTTNWSNKYLYGTGSAAGSNGTSTNFYAAGVGNPSTTTANTFSSGELYVPNFAGSNAKSVSFDTVTESNGSSALIEIGAALWNSTAAITSLTIAPESGVGNFTQYSTFSLYGLAAVGTTPVIAPYASGGDIIQTDGTYWYHAFLSSGTFTPAKGLSCDYLVVAGGGGGSGAPTANAGIPGGGAGGLRSTVTATGGGGTLESPLSLTLNTPYVVTIGAGGAGGTSGATAGTAGGNSTFSSITSVGGGRGDKTAVGGTGGSGAGGGYGYAGGAGTANQGYAGGANVGTNQSFGGAGGGGAGAVGTSIPILTLNGGAGGTGVAIPSFASATTTGVSNYYGGGGGGSGYQPGGATSGGAGGAGGGGAGAVGTGNNGFAGTANTGGGGGGGADSGAGGKGGSGIVIVRYAIQKILRR